MECMENKQFDHSNHEEASFITIDKESARSPKQIIKFLSFFHPTEVNMIPMTPLLLSNNFQVSWESTNQCTVQLNKVRHNKRWLVKQILNMVWETVNSTKHIKDQFKEWYHITLKDYKQAIWEFLIMIIQILIIRHEEDKLIFHK